MKFPYLVKRTDSRKWYLRIPVPDDLHHVFGRHDKCKSLRTEDRKEAERLYFSHPFVAEWKEKFEDARLGRPTGSTYDKLKRERLKRFRAAKKDIFEYADEHSAWIDPDFAYTHPDVHNEKQIVGDTENAIARKKIAQLYQDKAVGVVDAREADKQIEALQHLIAGTVPKNEPEVSSLPSLLKVLPYYYAEFKTTVSKPTYRKKKPHVDLFIKWVKDKPIDQYSLKDGNDFLERLKKKQARGKAKGQTLSPNAINAYMISVTQLFDWLQKRYGDAVVNPAKTIRVPEKKPINTKKPRTSFTTDELNKLFQVVKPDHPLFWAALIPLYSSMRVQATCQLRKRDIKKRDGIYYFDVHDRGENKLKNPGATREIPVHKRLIELGLLEYMASVEDYLFPSIADGAREYPNGHDRWADRLGLAFAKLLKQAKIKRKEITFTSLRHTHVDASREAGMSYSAACWIQGRKENSSMANYGEWRDLKRRKFELDKIEYDFVLSPHNGK